MEFNAISKCRLCGSRDLSTILDLGKHPLANSLKKRQRGNEKAFPLTLSYCNDCSLLQIRETIDKDILFKRYFWVTGTSSTARDFADTFYHKCIKVISLKKSDLVVEIASNDGTYLKPFIRSGINALGVDPAKNIVSLARKAGIRTVHAFWNKAIAGEIALKYGRARFVFARNVIAHVSELHDFVAGISGIIADTGIGAIEFHYVGSILRELQYDSIYHEHLCYFSIKTAQQLFGRYGLYVFHIEKSPISGGAYILYFSRIRQRKTSQYKKLKALEEKAGVNKESLWKEFARKCIKHKDASRALIASFDKERIIGFGSSARSSTYLNFCGFNGSHIAAIIDNNPLKQGLFSAGSAIPIVSLKDGFRAAPDLIFILAWNFRNEIVRECRKNGYKGRFIVPFPDKPQFLKVQ